MKYQVKVYFPMADPSTTTFNVDAEHPAQAINKVVGTQQFAAAITPTEYFQKNHPERQKSFTIDVTETISL